MALSRWALVPAALALIVASSAFAQGLYGEGVPEDAAFIRFVHASGVGESLEVTVDAMPFETLEAETVSPYFTLQGGEHDVRIGDLSKTVAAEPDTFYTIVVLEDELAVLEDPALDDPALALLVLCNFYDEPVSLEAEGERAFDLVEPGTCESVPVNAIEVELAVVAADERLGDEVAAVLERGEAYTVFVLAPTGDPIVTLVRAELVLN